MIYFIRNLMTHPITHLLWPYSSQTNGRNYFKFAPMIDDVSGSAQENFSDLTSKLKVTRGQKVNKGYNRCSANKHSLKITLCAVSVLFFRWTIKTGKFYVFINKVINICRTESYNLLLERKSKGLFNEYNESSSLERCHQLKWQKLNFGKNRMPVMLPKSRHFKMRAFRNAGI